MGAVKSDLAAKERALEESYPALNTAVGIKRLLSERGALELRQYAGDYDAVLMLIDLQTAISAAKLTDRQSEALRLVYTQDLTQEDAARQAGVGQEVISRRIDTAATKIAQVYDNWCLRGEGYTFEEYIGEDETNVEL